VTLLTTERLTLRPPEAGDFDALYALTETPEMRQFLGGDEPTRADSFARMLRNAGSWSLYGYGSFIVHERVSGAFVGNCGVFHSYRGLGDDFDNRAEAGWIIAQDHWGKGYAIEAMAAALDWFDGAHGSEVVAMIETGNAASKKVAAKLGFSLMRLATLSGASMMLYERA
jgi:RimJ/RimL family protein N-acetyltransferase